MAIAQAEALSIRTAAEQGADEYATRAQAEADALTDEAHSDAVELLDATKEECRRMVAEARDLRNRTLADLMARRRDLRVQLEELRAGKDSLFRVVDAVAAAVDALRERLVSAEDEARVAAEQAGEALERQPGHDELSELEEELAAAGRVLDEGAGAVVETVETIETVEVGAPEGGQLLGEDVPVKGGTSASRRSVDELFARIRASRAAEEAALGHQSPSLRHPRRTRRQLGKLPKPQSSPKNKAENRRRLRETPTIPAKETDRATGRSPRSPR